MRRKKRLQELTIKDNFMFGAVMADEEMCREFLEMVLGFPIEKVRVSKEHSLIYNPEYRGVRLDVYAKDDSHTRYNVEMQVSKDDSLPRRSRYYHSQIDMELLLSNISYSELPDSYVIFICDYDPCGRKKYRYSFSNYCREDLPLELGDGSCTVYLSTEGKNNDEVPKELVKFLKYVKADLNKSTEDFEDDFVKRLQENVRKVKESRKMEERYMLLEELLKTERNEGKAEGKMEGILDLLEDLGEVPDDLRVMIEEETSLSKLRSWLKAAAKAESIHQFMEQMQ
jgi:predicted transposase/invertase (TIGR01784 family)